jgi:pimeloyl-ACP methyl ester carboxylesterase
MLIILTFFVIFLAVLFPKLARADSNRIEKVSTRASIHPQIKYKTATVSGIDIFYREAGLKQAPIVILLHGFPSSSHMFRNLIPLLANNYHVIAPDYPGFGHSSMPQVTEFDYTFDNLANLIDEFTQQLRINKYSLYLMDYGAPIGFRMAVKHPERVQALIVQNGNAYAEGLGEYWVRLKAYWRGHSEADAEALRAALSIEATKWKYTHGTRHPDQIDPDNWVIDQYGLDRAGNKDIQLQLFYDYRSNVALYPQWQAYLRRYQPPTLIVWGNNDKIFPAEGAEAYKRDLKNPEFHLLDTGHFALEEDGDVIANYMTHFLRARVGR